MIPKKIHYCWLGGNPLPESAKKCIKSWRKYCPDYEIIEWNESNYDFTKNEYMRQALEAKKWGFVPDYARLDIIYNEGGIYLDTDVEMIRPFDELLQLKGFAGFQDEDYVALGLGFGAEPGNPVIKKLMDSYEKLSFLNEDGSLNLVPSPHLNTKTLVDDCGLIPSACYQELGSFSVFPPEYFCPKSFLDGVIRKTKNTFSIHHFDASWFSDESKKQLLDSWKHKQKRIKKLERRKRYGGFIRKILGNENWEKIKSKIYYR